MLVQILIFQVIAIFHGLFKDEISTQPEDGTIYNGIVKEVDGEKVGIFGLTTEETVNLSSPKLNLKLYEEAEKAVDAFEEAGC